MAQDWDIKPRGDACQQCQVSFADRQRYHAALVFEKEGYVRADYCETCWQQKDPANVLSYSMWTGVFKMPPPQPEEPLKKETAETLLRRLMEEDDPAHGNVIYILAVMLERNRIFVERDIKTNEDDVMVRVYEHKKTGETFIIPDPRLRLDQLDKVQEEVVNMLGGPKKNEGEAPAAPVEEKPASGDAQAPAEPVPAGFV